MPIDLRRPLRAFVSGLHGHGSRRGVYRLERSIRKIVHLQGVSSAAPRIDAHGRTSSKRWKCFDSFSMTWLYGRC